VKKASSPTIKQKKVTLHDVANNAGVSVATVSNVLNNTGSVGQTVKARVDNSLRTLNYRTNHSAKAMKTGKTQTLGLVVPDITNPFFSKLVQSIEEIARSKGYSVLLIDSRVETAAEQEGVRHLFQYGVDGIIWCPLNSNDTIAEFAPDIPTVVVDRPISNYDSVSSNYIQAEKLLAEHAIAQGHTRIGIASGPKKLESAELRKQSFIDHVSGDATVVWAVENAYSLNLNDSLKKRLLNNEVSLYRIEEPTKAAQNVLLDVSLSERASVKTLA